MSYNYLDHLSNQQNTAIISESSHKFLSCQSLTLPSNQPFLNFYHHRVLPDLVFYINPTT